MCLRYTLNLVFSRSKRSIVAQTQILLLCQKNLKIYFKYDTRWHMYITNIMWIFLCIIDNATCKKQIYFTSV